MSSPYWSGDDRADPEPGAGGPVRWPQLPLPGADRPGPHPAPAEPTVPLLTRAEGTAASPVPTQPVWPRSSATAPLPVDDADPHHLRPHVPPRPDVADPWGGRLPVPQPHPRQPYPPQPYPPQPYGYAVPAGPGAWPGQPVLWSERSRWAAGLLAFFLGLLGVHNFYLGHVGRGVVQLVLSLTGVGLLVTWVWVVVELVLILTGGLRDRHGRLLR